MMQKQEAPSAARSLHEIGDNDILCSKDKSLANHPGNRIFREQIEIGKVIYASAKDKLTKMKITKDIIKHIQTDLKCRFVKFDAESGSWLEVTPNEARDKVGHALRFAIKGSRKSSARRQTLAELAKKRRPLQASLPAPLPSTAIEPPVTKPLTIPHVSLEDVSRDVFHRQQQILQQFDSDASEGTREDERCSIQDADMNDEPLAIQWACMEPMKLDEAPKDPASCFSEDDLKLLSRVIAHDEKSLDPLPFSSSFFLESFELLNDSSETTEDSSSESLTGANKGVWR